MRNEKILSKPMIFYELPLNKVFQPIKNNSDISTAWGNAVKFISEATSADISSPIRLILTINSDENRDTSDLETEATALFGISDKHFDGIYNQNIWELKAENLGEAVNFIIKNQPYPKAVRPYINLRIDYDFYFVNPTTHELLPEQEVKSHIAFFLHKNSSCIPEFRFHFAECSNQFYKFLKTIKAYTPFKKFDKKSFRLVMPNKSGTGNISRKIILSEE